MQSRRWTTRGRPRGRGHTAANTKLLEYLAKISVKYRVDHNIFFNKIVEAWKNQRSKCKQLTIQCREKMKDQVFFLITTNHKVVAQFPIPEHILRETAALKDFTYIIERKKNALTKKANDRKARYLKIERLKTGMKRINVKARILEISRSNVTPTRYNDYIQFANVTLTDETGTVKLTLWDDRINSLSINDTVEIENAIVTAYKGETQLRIRRHSKLRVVHAPNHEESITRELEQHTNLNSIVTREHG